jgi:DNA-binding transcriptional ArsR family regulator
MGVSPSNASFHVKALERSGLIAQRRRSRLIVYRASIDALADLVTLLMQDCCAGHPIVRRRIERYEGCGKTDARGSEGDVGA